MYWIDIITPFAEQSRLTSITEEDLRVLIPIFATLGVFTSFGEVGSDKVLGGCTGAFADDTPQE